MTSFVRPMRLVAIAALFFAATFFSMPHVAMAADVEVPAPTDATFVLEVQAGGAQIYECREAAPGGAYAWMLVGPIAVLVTDDGKEFGTHTVGPRWTADDGSIVHGNGLKPMAKADRAGAVPALLLHVASTEGDGVLKGIRYVRRSDTEGGLAPATGCDAAHAEATTASRYSAVYSFYR